MSQLCNPAKKMPVEQLRKILLLILAFGLLVRIGTPATLSLDHFDEGIYALAGQWPFQPGGLANLDPSVIPYGPPVTPVLIGLCSFVLGGPSDFAAIIPGIISGTLAIWLTRNFCRRLLGDEAALIAATLVAFSGMAIAFSRTALTDTPLACLWLLAMIAGLKFLEKPSLKNAVAMGLCVGLCQLTKYNGALTGLIIATTAVLDFGFSFVRKKPEWRLFQQRIMLGTFGALIAFLVYLPWLMYVENHGGYRSLLNHHSGYVKPLASWPSNLKMQLVQAWAFDQFIPLKLLLGIILLLLVIAFQKQFAVRAKNETQSSPLNLLPNVAPLLISIILVPNAAWVVSIMRLPGLLKSERIGNRLLAVWFAMMSIITPVYHPYARLWLPAQMASFCIAALILAETIESKRGEKTLKRSTIASFAIYLLTPALISLAINEYHFKSNSNLAKNIYAGRGGLKRQVQTLMPEISQAMARGRVEMLVSPAVRWHLMGSLETGRARGALASQPSLNNWSGQAPLLLDQSLVSEAEISQLSALLQNRISAAAGPPPATQDRGLITTLDIQPDAPIKATLPRTDLLLVP